MAQAEQTAQAAPTVNITIDGTAFEVAAGKNLLQTALELGFDLPYFCWHPALGSAGACRQCAVAQLREPEAAGQEGEAAGKIVMACMTPVTEGAIFSLAGRQAGRFRKDVVESLMLNHPHDCPVCAEGGECHLQDMTVMAGHRDRRYRGRKNTHRNQYLGPLIHHEMNRCITCYRCTRYYRDYAGGGDLAALASRDRVYFGRVEDGVLESPFAGNLVEVCPTGVFTDKSLVHSYTRKWDLQSAPSVCVGCGLGCNTLPGERYGQLKRIHNRYHSEVNTYFLCDRGRFGGGFVNSEARLDFPAERDGGELRALTLEQTRERLTGMLGGKMDSGKVGAAGAGGEPGRMRAGRVVGIGSPRASLESNYALRKLVGGAHFCSGMSDWEHALAQRCLSHLGSTPAHNPSLREIEEADAVLVLGADVTHTAPRLALSLRQSVRNRALELASKLKLETWQDAAIRTLAQDERSPLHIVSGGNSDLDDVARSVHRLSLDEQARFAGEIADALEGTAPPTDSTAGEALVESAPPQGGGDGSAIRHSRASGNPEMAAGGRFSNPESIAADLKAARRPLVIVDASAGSEALADAGARIAAALCDSQAEKTAMLSFCFPECNTLGSAILSRDEHLSFAALAKEAADGNIDALIVLENDLPRRIPAETLSALREQIPAIIAIDCLVNHTLRLSDLALPAAAFTECDGTLINNEGRAQRFFAAYPLRTERRPGWQWLTGITQCMDGAQGAASAGEQSGAAELAKLRHVDEATAACAAEHELLAGILDAAPGREWRDRGLKVPRQSHRYSGRTAMRADVSVHEPKAAADDESALAFSMEGAAGAQRPGALLSYLWAPGWNSNQSLHKFQAEVGGELRGGGAGARLLDGFRCEAPGAAPLPGPFQPRVNEGEFQMLPRHRIFGSDELSRRSPGVAELVGEAGIELHPEDAAAMGFSMEGAAGDGDGAAGIARLGEQRLQVRGNPAIPRGCAGYSAGYDECNHLQPGQWAHLEKRS